MSQMPPPGHPSHPEMSPNYGPGGLGWETAGPSSVSHEPSAAAGTLDQAIAAEEARSDANEAAKRTQHSATEARLRLAVDAMKDFLSRGPSHIPTDTWIASRPHKLFGPKGPSPDPAGLNDVVSVIKTNTTSGPAIQTTFKGAWCVGEYVIEHADNDSRWSFQRSTQWYLSTKGTLIIRVGGDWGEQIPISDVTTKNIDRVYRQISHGGYNSYGHHWWADIIYRMPTTLAWLLTKNRR